MKQRKKSNSNALYAWIAENGDQFAREIIYKETLINQSTLSRVLSNSHMPKWETRYRIFKLTGIKLNDEDEFPVLKMNAG